MGQTAEGLRALIYSLDNKELAERINVAARNHIPNIDLPTKYRCIVEGIPLIYAEGMKYGFELALKSTELTEPRDEYRTDKFYQTT
jgi:hypothetical protein